ncbi:MAG: HesA/MoeB/ThiF family protein [Dehalococcoidales bacterium]|nr:HesA/MoeB/ThiF family protein [Dehalococcoidales bacterium]
MLNENELARYDRQIIMRGFGEEGQEKLKNAKIFVAGCGGLGSPVLVYLAVAGIGTIRIVDEDTIDISNLNRQILHWDADVGRVKVESGSEKLRGMNGQIAIEPIRATIDETNAEELTAGFDLIVDAMDNLHTRFILNQAAIKHNIPFFHGAVQGLEGRVSTIIPGKTACLRCIYRGEIPKTKFPVIGTTPGVIGSIQATEVIKYLTGIGDLLEDRLLVYDGQSMKFMELKVKRDPECPHCGHLPVQK